jgi:hypothetical protein
MRTSGASGDDRANSAASSSGSKQGYHRLNKNRLLKAVALPRKYFLVFHFDPLGRL